MYVIGLVLFFNESATTDIYTYCHTLSLHDALPIYDSNCNRTRGLRPSVSMMCRLNAATTRRLHLRAVAASPWGKSRPGSRINRRRIKDRFPKPLLRLLTDRKSVV